MPLPIILIPIIIVIVIMLFFFGIISFITGKINFNKAKAMRDELKKRYISAQERLKNSKQITEDSLIILGKLKIKTWKNQIKKFCEIIDLIKDIEIIGAPSKDELMDIKITNEEITDMKKASIDASTALSGSVQTSIILQSALYGSTTYLATQIGTASTGVALSSLSGAAATNATLAWFGGGSLAIGGFGMAGGTIVLGGITIGPAIAVSGFIFNMLSRKELAKAEILKAKVDETIIEIDKAISVLNSIKELSNEHTYMINKLNDKMVILLNRLKVIIKNAKRRERQQKKKEILVKKGLLKYLEYIKFIFDSYYKDLFKLDKKVSYIYFIDEEKRILYTSYLTAQTLKRILETPILDKSGNINNIDYSIIHNVNKILDEK